MFFRYLLIALISLVDFLDIVGGKPPVFKLWTNQTLPRRRKDITGVNNIIRGAGATTEVYKVTTEDGYVLQLTRLMNLDGIDMNTKEGRGTPVLLIHGQFAAYDIWITRGRGYDLPILLMDLGYDVWLCDKRGNYFTKNHVNLTANDPRFWKFSIHEMGYYDLASFIDTIIAITKRPKVVLIGHSLGTSDFYILCSERPEYNKKVLVSFSFAPLGFRFYASELLSPYSRFAYEIGEPFIRLFIDLGFLEAGPRTETLIKSLIQFCGTQPTQDYCLDAIGTTFGEHRQNINRKHIPQMSSRFPAGGSTRATYHIAQIFLRGFRQYDEGRAGNMRKYGTPTPPPYSLNKITAPAVFYYAMNDYLTSNKGMKMMARKIPGVFDVRQVSDPKFNHIDYIFGDNAQEVLYKDVAQLIKKIVG